MFSFLTYRRAHFIRALLEQREISSFRVNRSASDDTFKFISNSSRRHCCFFNPCAHTFDRSVTENDKFLAVQRLFLSGNALSVAYVHIIYVLRARLAYYAKNTD